MDNLDIEIVKHFRAALHKKLIEQFQHNNFEITSAAKTWMDSVVEYYASTMEDNLENYDSVDELIDELKYDDSDNIYEFDWPNTTEASKIVGKAVKNDNKHFIYITDELNLSISPDDCFKAKWFWKGSIKSDILSFIESFLIEHQ